jgi:hypothetical protein
MREVISIHIGQVSYPLYFVPYIIYIRNTFPFDELDALEHLDRSWQLTE